MPNTLLAMFTSGGPIKSAVMLDAIRRDPGVCESVDAATGKSRLKRVVLIGDHHQLPPVVKNQAFQTTVFETSRRGGRFHEVDQAKVDRWKGAKPEDLRIRGKLDERKQKIEGVGGSFWDRGTKSNMF